MKTVILGIGNPMKGDDSAGHTVIKLLQNQKLKNKNLILINCETVPENYIGKVVKLKPDMIVIIDAADFAAKPGTLRLMDKNELAAVTLSTHSLSLEYIIKYLEFELKNIPIFIIGIQAKNTNLGDKITPEVSRSVKLITSKNIPAEIILKGTVQGVGFRPYIHKLADKLKTKGYVKNFTGGVKIEIEGNIIEILTFFNEITGENLPRVANIVEKNLIFKSPKKQTNIKQEFKISKSETKGNDFVLMPPDISVCDNCLKELATPKDRRYDYPFINCINCGPRFTIVKNIPYDRQNTTMDEFIMCKQCNAEYKNIKNRRYHAEPNACPICGPSVTLIQAQKNNTRKGVLQYAQNMGRQGELPLQKTGNDAIKQTINLLKNGEIVAVKGIGGFHLLCDATNEKAVRKLRTSKTRAFKPFAVMSSNINKIKKFAEISGKEEKLLISYQRPIVLLKKKNNSLISKSVAPDNNYVGVMLPYTPLHYLLTETFLCLVATSGNLSDEPLIKDNNEAVKKLSGFTGFFLTNNRHIETRCDDSVIKIISDKPSLIRRARGWTPMPIKLPGKSKSILAAGAEIKNTFCITRDNFAFVSQHIGDLKDYETYREYISTIEHFKKLFRIKPEIIAYDLHPEYFSTKYALELEGVKKIGIQHHWAHIASCMAENNINSPVIGVAFDGTGYGLDKNIWGGEFLVCDYKKFERIMHFKYMKLPGGDRAAVEIWRMAISCLFDSYNEKYENLPDNIKKKIKRWKDYEPVYKMLKKNINCPLSSGIGRIFDAVASIIGVCDLNTCEGESAMKLEKLAEDWFWKNSTLPKPYGYEIRNNIIDFSTMIREISVDISPIEKISAKFHYTMANIIIDGCTKIKKSHNINKVALSGGVFQNKVLTEFALRLLKKEGFEVHTHSLVPTNDGGISLGQAAIAQASI